MILNQYIYTSLNVTLRDVGVFKYTHQSYIKLKYKEIDCLTVSSLVIKFKLLRYCCACSMTRARNKINIGRYINNI